MVNSYYGIYQAERGKITGALRTADAPSAGRTIRGLSLELPCTEDPELFFAESPQDVEQAKAMCRGCGARLACLGGALERGEPWGVWGGELLMNGLIVPRKRARGRPRAHSGTHTGARARTGWDVVGRPDFRARDVSVVSTA